MALNIEEDGIPLLSSPQHCLASVPVIGLTRGAEGMAAAVEPYLLGLTCTNMGFWCLPQLSLKAAQMFLLYCLSLTRLCHVKIGNTCPESIVGLVVRIFLSSFAGLLFAVAKVLRIHSSCPYERLHMAGTSPRSTCISSKGIDASCTKLIDSRTSFPSEAAIT